MATAPSVLVTDVNNNPVTGVSVTFAVASGGGSVDRRGVDDHDATGIATGRQLDAGHDRRRQHADGDARRA